MTPYEIETFKGLLRVADEARTRAIDAAGVGNAKVEEWAKATLAAEELLENEQRTEEQETFSKQLVRGMTYFVVVGPNVWGRGFSVEQALAAAGKDARKKHIVWKANTKQTPLAYIDDMGGLCWRGVPPARVAEKGIPGRKDFNHFEEKAERNCKSL